MSEQNNSLPHLSDKVFLSDGGLGFVLDTPTWRASSDWLQRLGYDANEVHEINREAAELMEGIRQEFQTVETPMVIAGAVGPRGDGYVARTNGLLPDGDPEEFGQLCADRYRRFSNLSVFGGCCGTDHRHVDAAQRAIE
jgi:methionine synthase I (cobalamin-dependent)